MNTLMLKSLLLKSTPKVNIPRQYTQWALSKIGSREVVGFGTGGEPDYLDSVTFPFPAIRYREITPDLKALREKEKGDWKSLSLAEKKCLYRVSFCQTFEETIAPTGEWKVAVGSALLIISLGIWLHLLVTYLTKNPDGLPTTFQDKYQEAQLKRMIDLRVAPISGISSKWDYEKNTWK